MTKEYKNVTRIIAGVFFVMILVAGCTGTIRADSDVVPAGNTSESEYVVVKHLRHPRGATWRDIKLVWHSQSQTCISYISDSKEIVVIVPNELCLTEIAGKNGMEGE